MSDIANERAIEGMKAIAETLGMSIRACYNRRQEWVDAGVIFYIKKGKPRRRIIHHFPSKLKAYCSLKAAKGENI